MNPYFDKVALITGGASGIGRALAQQLARSGATVLVADVNSEGVVEVATELTASGGKAEGLRLNVTDAADFERVVQGVFERHGRLDFFFNNAGIGGPYAELHEVSLEEWKRVLEVDLHGVVHGIAAVYPRMVKQGFGHIINTASIAGLIPTPMMGPYATAKHAVVGLSKTLQVEARAHGVRVSVVCPGLIDTAFFKKSVKYQAVSYEKSQTLAPPMMSSEDCAQVILRRLPSAPAVIPVTGLAWVAWWLWRLFPRLTLWVAEKQLRQVRRLR